MIKYNQKHYFGLDWLRGVSAFFIVGCHIGLIDRTPMGTALTHFCDLNVGVFAAISGFLLQKSLMKVKLSSVWEVVCKRIKRLLPVYLVWTLFYCLVRVVVSKGDFNVPWCHVIFGGGSACTLWFLINLLYAQIAICILSSKMRHVFNSPWLTFIGALACLIFSIAYHGYLGYYTTRLCSFVLLGWCCGASPPPYPCPKNFYLLA